MNFKEYFNKLDESILKKSPFNWIIGWHIFIPLILILFLLGIGVSSFYPVRNFDYIRHDNFTLPSFFLGFLSLLVFILFVIRQIKYNSSRIHHRLPFVKSNMNFFSFLIVLLLLTLVPLVPVEFYSFRVNLELNSRTDDFEKDRDVFRKGVFYFESANYNSRNVNRDISKPQAIERITSFLEVAQRYDIVLSEYDPEEIYLFSQDSIYRDYNLFLPNAKIARSLRDKTDYSNYDRMFYNYSRTKQYDLHEIEVLYFIMYSIISYAFLLWIFVSVTAREFGLAILWLTLLSILVGILIGASYYLNNSDGFARLIVYFVAIAIFIVAFSLKAKNKFSSVMKIISQFIIPLLSFLIFMEYYHHFLGYHSNYENLSSQRDDFWLVVSIAGPLITIGSVFFYKYVYGKKTILPK